MATSERDAPPRCARAEPPAGWSELLPPELLSEVVRPTRGERFTDDLLPADRTVGYAVDDRPCYSATRHRLAAPASDDDETFVERAAVSECTTAWRLRDGRWLVHHSVLHQDRCPAVEQASYFIAPAMPR